MILDSPSHTYTRLVLAAFALSSILCFLPSNALGQISVEKGAKTLPLGPDTLCFRYRFDASDTLVYHVEALDSILFMGQPTLLKKRSEYVAIICDSVGAGERYHLRVILEKSDEKQYVGEEFSERNSSSWIGRTAYIVIDSLGNRYVTRPDDESKGAITPGGAFQPLLLPTFGESCGRQNQSWMIEDTTLLVENGVPEPAFAHATLWRVLDMADTLGRKFQQIQYSQTALASLTVTSSWVNMKTEAVIASGGKLTMDVNLQVPFHIFALSQNTLTIKFPNGKEEQGKHLTSSHASLVELRSLNKNRRLQPTQEP